MTLSPEPVDPGRDPGGRDRAGWVNGLVEHVHPDPEPATAMPADRPALGSRSWLSSWLPIVRLPLVVAMVVVAIATAFDGRLAVAAWGVAGLAVLDWLVAGSPWKVGLGRNATPVLTLGEQGWVVWSLVPSRPWRQRVAVADDLVPTLGVQRRAEVTLERTGTSTVTVPMLPTRRGRHHLDHAVVRVAGPLRLVARQHQRDLPGRIDVHPAFPSRREAELRVVDRRVQDVGRRSVRALGSGTDFESLRDYTMEDQLRRVDWSATARAGKPIVRTYRSEQNQVVQVLLDAGRLSAGVVEGVARLDHLMDVALAVATVAVGVGDRVGFAAFAQGTVAAVPVSRVPHQRALVGAAMADLEPALVESDYERAFTEAVARQRRRALLVVLTDLSSESLLETLVPALPVLLRRHLVIVAAVDDPRVRAWVGGQPSSSDEAYRAAGAVQVTRSRRRTARLLRRLGAVVVDEPPGPLAPAVMDAYLDMKAAGRL